MTKLFFLDDCDWIVAESYEQAAAFGRAELGMGDDGEDDLVEVSDAQLDKLRYFDDIENQKHSTSRSFRKQLQIEAAKGAEVPRYFATTEY